MGIDPQLAPEFEGLPRIGPEELGHDAVRNLSLNLLVDSGEEVLLTAEVVVKGTFRHLGLRHDLVEGRIGEPSSRRTTSGQRRQGRHGLPPLGPPC